MRATASCNHGNFTCCHLGALPQLALPLQRPGVPSLTPSLTFPTGWPKSQKIGLLLLLLQLTSHYSPTLGALSSGNTHTHTYTHRCTEHTSGDSLTYSLWMSGPA